MFHIIIDLKHDYIHAKDIESKGLGETYYITFFMEMEQ